MDFFTYLEHLKNNEKQDSLIIFHRSSYYSDTWHEVLKEILNTYKKIQCIDTAEQSVRSFIQSTSVQSIFHTYDGYCLNGFELTAALRKEWLTAVSQSAVRVYFCLATEDIKSVDNMTSIQIPTTINRQQAGVLSTYKTGLAINKEKLQYFLDALYNLQNIYFLEDIWLLLEYVPLLSAQALDLFLREWVVSLLHNDTSLFQLSAAFFSYDKKKFVAEWNAKTSLYQPVFWTSYWSDQIWRAALFIKYMRTHDAVRAKEIQAKLPFSFIRHEWKKWDYKKLVMLHERIMQADLLLKNGGNIVVLESALLNHF